MPACDALRFGLRRTILRRKTARFTKSVEKCGKPEVHLVLIDPAKDRTLHAAVKGHRVMTIWQEAVGTKADRGKVGFEPGPGRQFLIFPSPSELLRAAP
jgi:hypothetical protein